MSIITAIQTVTAAAVIITTFVGCGLGGFLKGERLGQAQRLTIAVQGKHLPDLHATIQEGVGITGDAGG